MCGFVGFVGKSDEKKLKISSNFISHRGPDDESFISGEDYSVAFKRLSILDLSKNGMQPFKKEKITVFLNGEIYNYIELQKRFKNEFKTKGNSDGEILPFLYNKLGINFLNLLNGMFSIVIIDENIKKVFLIRDRFAKKPLFYKYENNTFFFTSEIKALRLLVKLTPDYNNLFINLGCLFLPQGTTLFRDIFGVSPGSYVEVSYEKSINYIEKKWYKPKFENQDLKKDEVFEKVDNLLTNSTKLRLRSDVPVGIFLSGGLDSTCIADYAKNISTKTITAFTANIKDKPDNSNKTDFDVPSKFCSELSLDHQLIDLDFNFFNKNYLDVIKNCEELFLDSGNLVTYGLSKEASKKGIKVVLKGNGGDEIFGGYPWQNHIRHIPSWVFNNQLNTNINFSDFLSLELLNKNRKIFKLFQIILSPHTWHAETLSNGIFSDLISENRKDYYRSINFLAKNIYNKNKLSFSGDNYNLMNFLNIYYTLGGGNYMGDMGTMNSSIENRAPLLDFNLVEFMFSLSDKFKNKFGTKGLMREFLKWKKFPTYITQAKKSGPTINTAAWLQKLNENKLIENFFNKNSNLIKYIFKKNINFRQFLKIKNGKDPYIIFGLLGLILWYKFHIEYKNIESNTRLTDVLLEI